MSKSLTRNFKIESMRADDNGEGFWATLSTEYAVPRDYGNEILLHTPSAIDLERAPLPLITTHNTEELNIGIVERIKIVGRKLKGFIRFSKSARVQELVEDVKAGILTSLSIAYYIIEHQFEGDDLIATKWAPYEVSMVSVGADPHAGIGRSIKSEKFKMNEKVKMHEPGQSRGQKAIVREATEKERERVGEIEARTRGILKRIPENNSRGRELLIDEKERFIKNGWPWEDFAARAADIGLQHMEDSYSPSPASHVGVSMGFSGYSGGCDPNYSIQRILQAAIDPRNNNAEYELGISEQLKRGLGRKGNSVLIPIGRQQRSMNTASIDAGGAIVPTNLEHGHFIEALVAQSAILNLPGITTFNETEGDLVLPRAVSNPTAGTSELDDVDTIPETDAVLDEITMTPTSITALTKLSHKLIMQSSPDAEQMIRSMLATEVGVKLDFLSVQGDGLGANPTGVLNVNGIGATTYPNATAPTWEHVVGLEGELTVDSVKMHNVAYLVGPAMAVVLKTTEKATGTAKYLLEEGMMNGFPVVVSANVPANTILIGSWSDFILATWGVLQLDVDPYGTEFAKGNVRVRAILDCDISVRHEQSFAKLTEAP